MAAPNKEKQKPKFKEETVEETLVRIAGYDIKGNKNLLVGLTKIKGISWSLSNATCLILKMPKTKKISELTKEEIEKIETFIKNPKIPDFLKNRQKDFETGETKHYIGTDLEMKKDFDIRRLKKIRSYKGVRHTAHQPVRGQQTRAHFRKKGQAVSVTKKGAKGKKT
ncbi:MAG: 30S ribosomal protein S13 [archaeon]